MARSLDYIETARRLLRPASARSRRPRQSDLKRALSTAYYAMFHSMCWNCADCLIGTNGADRSTEAWRQAYRAVDHGFAKKQCGNQQVISRFPKAIEDFVNQFRNPQEKRHVADYDPISRFYRTDVETEVDAAEMAIKGLQDTSRKHRRAFAVWTAMKSRSD